MTAALAWGRAARALLFAWALALAFALALGWSGPAAAQVPVPPLRAHVTDLTGTLDAAQQAALEQMLTAFEARKGSQLAVLMVPTTAPETIEQFAIRVAEAWKLGRKRVDDGAILIVAKDDRAVRIEVGYGLEGALTDLTSRRIISETILPRFKAGDFHGGISAGVAQMARVVDGEPLPEPVNAPGRGGGSDGGGGLQDYLPVLFIVALAVGGVLRAVLGKLLGSVVTGGVVGLVAWFVVGAVSVAVGAGLVALFVTLLGVNMGRMGGLGGYHGGGRGGGGGGFSGGGGGFGGGGASGRW